MKNTIMMEVSMLFSMLESCHNPDSNTAQPQLWHENGFGQTQLLSRADSDQHIMLPKQQNKHEVQIQQQKQHQRQQQQQHWNKPTSK